MGLAPIAFAVGSAAVVVLQLPAVIPQWQAGRLRTAVAEVASEGHTPVCFWWIDTPAQAPAEAVRSVNQTCHGRLVVWATTATIQESMPVPAISGAPKSWQWFYADVPWIIAARQARSLIAAGGAIFYIEWDVGWTGSLGSIVTALAPPSRAYHYGIFRSFVRNCTALPDYHGCRGAGKDTRIVHGIIPVVWHSLRLLDELYEKVYYNDTPTYCEANAATVCAAREWCRIDALRARAPGAFGHYDYHRGELSVGKAPNQLYHPVKTEARWNSIRGRPAWSP